MPDRWLTVEEAAERVGRHVQTIRKWVREGDLKLTLKRTRESDLLEADRVMRERAKQPKRRLHLDLVLNGEKVGTVAYNPKTGAMSGELRPDAFDARS